MVAVGQELGNLTMKQLTAAVAACLAIVLLTACEQEKEAPPPPEPINLAKADNCFRARDFPCAARGYYVYLKAYPSDRDVSAKLGLSRHHMGRHREALGPFKTAIDLGVSTYDVHAAYAISLEASGNLEEAIRQNRLSLAIVPTLVDVRGNLANQLERTGKVDEALKLLQDFDRDLVRQGHAPYFRPQIEAIKARQAARPAS